MILRHILSQFTKFVLGDRKYFQDMMCYHGNYDVRPNILENNNIRDSAHLQPSGLLSVWTVAPPGVK